jgi:GNAT superfamily N-acetyltransferase
MIQVERLGTSNINGDDVEQLAELFCRVFPDQAGERGAFVERMRKTWLASTSPPPLCHRLFVARDGSGSARRIVASANLAPRSVMSSHGPRTIAALYAVKSDPAVRGLGFGKAVVRAAFDCVDAGEFPFALFQTNEARRFYEKLGCRLVTNRIVNSRDPADPNASPFWEPYVMCYAPRRDELPGGEIDLLGPGY